MGLETNGTAPFRVIITGTTGMVGEGVLHECLSHPDVQHVLVINRQPCGISHPKLTEILHHDFFDLSSVASQVSHYHACFFCLGVSSVGRKEAEYSRLTYDLTIHAASLLSLNPDMVFCYVSGSGTDSTEQGKSMWARVKGRTENQLFAALQESLYFRPGYIHPTAGLKNTHRYYHALSLALRVFRVLLPKHVVTLREVGIAMIHSVTKGNAEAILECKDIVKLAKA